MEDSLSGIRVVKSFANEAVEAERFEAGNREYLEVKKVMYRSMAGFHSVTRLFDGLMYITVVLAGALFMIARRITSADLVAYLLYVTALLASIRRLVEFTEQYQRGITGIERFVEVMDQNLHELVQMSSTLSLDDYGIGYSNIQRLRKLPLDIIKIGKSPADDMYSSWRNTANTLHAFLRPVGLSMITSDRRRTIIGRHFNELS